MDSFDSSQLDQFFRGDDESGGPDGQAHNSEDFQSIGSPLKTTDQMNIPVTLCSPPTDGFDYILEPNHQHIGDPMFEQPNSPPLYPYMYGDDSGIRGDAIVSYVPACGPLPYQYAYQALHQTPANYQHGVAHIIQTLPQVTGAPVARIIEHDKQPLPVLHWMTNSELPAQDTHLHPWNLNAEAAYIEMPPKTQRRKDNMLNDPSVKGTAVDNPWPSLLPKKLAKETKGWYLRLLQSRGFSRAEMTDRVPEETWSGPPKEGSKDVERNGPDLAGGQFSSMLGRYHEHNGLLADPGRVNYQAGNKAFDEDMHRLIKYSPVQILFNTPFKIHADGTQTCFTPHEHSGTPVAERQPAPCTKNKRALRMPQELSKRRAMLLTAAGLPVYKLAVLGIFWEREFPGSTMPAVAKKAVKKALHKTRVLQWPCKCGTHFLEAPNVFYGKLDGDEQDVDDEETFEIEKDMGVYVETQPGLDFSSLPARNTHHVLVPSSLCWDAVQDAAALMTADLALIGAAFAER